MTPTIVVTGSLNLDFVVTVDRLPAPGQTVLGGGFLTNPGGKGANQAFAAATLGGLASRTKMIGRVGYDLFGDQQKASLAAAGVDVSAVHATRLAPTGVAFIWVERGTAQNSIVVAPGANETLTAKELEALRAVFDGSRCALFQLETPLEAVAQALKIAREAGAQTILDPAPAQLLSREILERVDILTPNETEACLLLGRPPARLTREDAPAIAAALLDAGARSIILKLGDQGCFYRDREESIFSEGFAVTAVDTTAAGDTFNAALAVALAESKSMKEALRFANAAGALSVTQAGAQASCPSRSEVETLMSQPG